MKEVKKTYNLTLYVFCATMEQSEKRGRNMGTRNEYLSVRIDPKLKADFYNFCEKSGISVSAAVNQLAVKSVEKGSIPFVVHVVDYDLKKNGETNRTSIRMRAELRQGFAEVCNKTGIPMSTVVKMFMLQCIDKGRFPFDV